MLDHAKDRLSVLGRLFEVLGEAGKSWGRCLQGLGGRGDEEDFRAAVLDVANLLQNAAEVCDELRDVTRRQAELGLVHGYDESDSAALATLKIIMRGFSALPVFISQLEFTDDAAAKDEQWRSGAAILRASAQAATDRIDVLLSVLAISANV